MLRSSRNESVHALQLANKVQDKAESQKGEKEEAFKKYKVTATWDNFLTIIEYMG